MPHRLSPREVSSVLAAMLFVTACGTTTQFAATNPAPRAMTPRPAESVMVFATGLPNRPFVEVGVIQAQQSSEFSLDDMPEVLAEMRTEAGRRGCDGLVINGTRDAQTSSVSVSKDSASSHSYTLEGFWGACIVFVVDPPPTLATSSPATTAATSGSVP